MSSNRSDTTLYQAADLPGDFATALERARGRLGTLGSTVVYFPTVGSTNDVAATLAARADAEGTVVVADSQTAGRGRRGHEWFSPSGSGLYVSVVLVPGRAPHGRGARAARLVTLAAGTAVAEAIETAAGLRVDVKWPNDLYVCGRKLAGILAEGTGVQTGDPIVLGYGINVGPAAFPPELRDRATSLETELGRPVERAALLAESLAALARRYDDLIDGRFDAILDGWRARAPGCTGASVSWTTHAGRTAGVTAGVDGDGALLVLVGDRVERVVAGEIQWLSPDRSGTVDRHAARD